MYCWEVPRTKDYNDVMERIVDKLIVLMLCALSLATVPFSNAVLVAFLLAISTGALFDTQLFPQRFRLLLPLFFLLVTLFVPQFVLCIPLAAYDLFRLRTIFLRYIWLVPLAASMRSVDLTAVVAALAIAIIACLLSYRSSRFEFSLTRFKVNRDELYGLSHQLETRYRDLQERQDLEVRVATLGERGRIAREIHDNVGHLLTRSVLQIEALQVVHRHNEQLTDDLAKVADTLGEAFDSIRQSVHGLHDEAFDLHTQLSAISQEQTAFEVQLDFKAEDLPQNVAYSFLAIVREALSNVSRHSDATAVRISVMEFPGLFQLTIKDNGNRFPATSSSHKDSQGIGLQTMEERARSLGGVFRTSYDRGFKVFASVPKTP